MESCQQVLAFFVDLLLNGMARLISSTKNEAMKNPLRVVTLLICILFNLAGIQAQEKEDQPETQPTLYLVVKNDGTRFVGSIISQDAREVLLDSKELGQVYIPRHEIREIRELSPQELTKTGEYIVGELFATRYFFTTNGLSVQKGDHYMLFSLLGPDFQFGISDKIGVGIMTSWIGIPIIGTVKAQVYANQNYAIGLGLLAGTDTWGGTGFRTALPFAAFTFGNRKANFNFSVGYGALGYKRDVYSLNGNNNRRERVIEGRMLISFATMIKLGRVTSIVVDSFIAPTLRDDVSGLAIFFPGLRFQTNPNRAFQFGFGGVRWDGETFPSPVTMIQYFRKI